MTESQIRGDGDLWVVEATQTDEGEGDFHVCVIVEFRNGKISRETRCFGPRLGSLGLVRAQAMTGTRAMAAATFSSG